MRRQIFYDHFDDQTIGQPPTNWEVNYPEKITIQPDPDPSRSGDKALRMLADTYYTYLNASRSFPTQSEVVDISFKFYVAQATAPSTGIYVFSEMIVFSGTRRILTLFLFRQGSTLKKVAAGVGQNKMIILGEWLFNIWHTVRIRFEFGGIFNWVKIFLDDQAVPFSFGTDFVAIDRIFFTARAQNGHQTKVCTVYFDDVKCEQEPFVLIGDYFCPSAKFTFVDEITSIDVVAGYNDGGVPFIPFNWQTGFEPTNLLHQHLGKTWRSALVNPRPTSNSCLAEHLVLFDLWIAQRVDVVGILNQNLAYDAFLPTKPLREVFVIATNDVSKPPQKWDYCFDLSLLAIASAFIRKLTYSDESYALLGFTNIILFPKRTYRYWALYIRQWAPIDWNTGEYEYSKLDYFEVGRIIFGKLEEFPYNFSEGWELEVVDPSKVVSNLANAYWARTHNPYRKVRLDFNLDDMQGEQITAFFAQFRKEPKIYIFRPEIVNRELLKSSWLYGRLMESDVLGLNFVFNDYANYEVELAEEVW